MLTYYFAFKLAIFTAQFLPSDCRNMLFQLIEPKPILRLPASELCHHVWMTRSGVYPLDCDFDYPVDVALQDKVRQSLSDPHLYLCNPFSQCHFSHTGR